MRHLAAMQLANQIWRIGQVNKSRNLHRASQMRRGMYCGKHWGLMRWQAPVRAGAHASLCTCKQLYIPEPCRRK